jgi:signal transduction histidine kinase
MGRVKAHRVVLGAVVSAELATLAGVLATDWHLASVGRTDLTTDAITYLALVTGMLVAVAVGGVVAYRQPSHPVGWLFLALAGCMVLGGAVDQYAIWTIRYRPGSLPGPDVAAVFSDSSWIPWFPLLAWILLLTPDGQHLSPQWRAVAWLSAASGGAGFVSGLFSREDLDVWGRVDNPLRVAFAPVLLPVSAVCVYVMAVCLVAAGASVIVRFRRSRGDERKRLLWLVVALVPLPLFVVGAFVAASIDSDVLTLASSAGFVTLIPVAAALSVLRYRLYDVDRVLTATAVYSLLTAALVATYATVVWLGAELGTRWGAGPAISATAGAVGAAAVAAPLRRVIQTALDRRFNRRAYDARQVVRAELAEEDAGIDLAHLFRRALGDDSVTVAYPADDAWVAPDGSAAPASGASVPVTRHGRVVARIGFDPGRIDATTVSRTAALAATELDNARLRAELARQLEEVDASRRRLTSAQRTERRRIERDLHDGAQQTLLALAFELQSAQVNGNPERMRAALATGAASARDAVRELRELANGLHPAALVDGGLPAALDDMARHSPVPLRLEVSPDRLDPALEFTAWMVLGEAIVNAQKHADADAIDVGVVRRNGHLHLRVADDGRGGANPDGPGLRGIRDRVEAVQGDLAVSSGPSGTTVEAVLPCGS